MTPRVPDVVRSKAELVGAQAWLVGLPDLIARLEARWRITVGAPYPDPTEAYVATAVRDSGEQCVLKLLVPQHPQADAREIATLRLASGRGCARLLEADPGCGALLLERLGPALSSLDRPLEQRLTIMTDLAQRLWRPAAEVVAALPEEVTLPDAAQKARSLADFVAHHPVLAERNELGPAVGQALAAADRLATAHDPARSVLCHGDVHQWSTLQRLDDPDEFALVDPDGLLTDPEYDLGVLMREDPVDLLADGPRDRARRLADRTNTDPARIWQWGIVERVSTGLLAVSVGLQPVGDQMLHAAAVIAATDDWRW